ncbi:MAG: peroxide stress protein YaaA [Piscirickettsiaceae bacterium]|nr:MAG: peroxide stress protein YaaA [Piscirickettsiaceae bacterium]PCI69102.1 MAG: peroxide stress protein YaaA [Piscirickettsiaceae bacterium]
MLLVISPAKTLDFETPSPTKQFSDASFLNDSAELIDQLKTLSPSDVSSLMSISDKLGVLNSNRFVDWQLPFTTNNSKQALLAFKGDVYEGMQADAFTEDDFEWANNHLRILSGLYGLLKPLDLIQAYRLEMGTRFANPRGKNLYEFWGDRITDKINQEALEQKSPVLINLASNEYFKSIKPKLLKPQVITPVFKDWKNDKYKIISFYAKKARGMMSAYIIKNRLESPNDIKQFDTAGYVFSAEQSNESEWVFLRKQVA